LALTTLLTVKDNAMATLSAPSGSVRISTRDFTAGTGALSISSVSSTLLQSRNDFSSFVANTLNGSGNNININGKTVASTAKTLQFTTEALSISSGAGYPLTLATAPLTISGSTFTASSALTGRVTQSATSNSVTSSGAASIGARLGDVVFQHNPITFSGLTSSVMSGANLTIASSGAVAIQGNTEVRSTAGEAVRINAPSVTFTQSNNGNLTAARDLLSTAVGGTQSITSTLSNVQVAADSSVSVSGPTLTVTATAGNVIVSGGSHSLMTDASFGGGIVLSSTTGATSITSTNSSIEFKGAQAISVSSSGKLQSTQQRDIVLRGQPQQLTSQSTDFVLTANNMFNVSSSAAVTYSVTSSNVFNASQDITFDSTRSSAVISSGALTVSGGTSFGVQGASTLIKSDASSTTSTISGALRSTSSYPGATTFLSAKTDVGLTSSTRIMVSQPETLVLSSDFGASMTVTGTNQIVLQGGRANFTAPMFKYTAPQLLSFTSSNVCMRRRCAPERSSLFEPRTKQC
jgi:hypothetical protein